MAERLEHDRSHLMPMPTPFDGYVEKPARVSSTCLVSVALILAPLAVLPAFQRQGVGQALIEHGASTLTATGVQLLLVLGEPASYTRCGFVSPHPYALRAPYPIVPEQPWMVRPLSADVVDSVTGVVRCADSLTKPEYWRE